MKMSVSMDCWNEEWLWNIKLLGGKKKICLHATLSATNLFNLIVHSEKLATSQMLGSIFPIKVSHSIFTGANIMPFIIVTMWWGYDPGELQQLKGLLSICVCDGTWVNMEQHWNDTDEKAKGLKEKPATACAMAQSYHHISQACWNILLKK